MTEPNEITEINADPTAGESPEADPYHAANAEQEAAIKAIEAEWQAKGLGEEGEGAEEGGEAVADAVSTEAPPPVEAALAEETPAAPAEEDRSLARLVEREVALRQREESLKSQEAEVTKLRSEIEQLREASKSYQGDFHDQLRLRVGDTLRAAGHDPEHVVRLYLAEKLVADGKPVPPELQRVLDKAEYDYKYSQLNHRQAEFERQQSAAQWVAGIELGARTYIQQGLSTNDAPTFAAVAKANPEWAFKAVMDEIAADVQSRAGKDLSATVLTYPEAAKRAEQKLAHFKTLLGTTGPNPDASTTAPTTPAPKVAPKGSSPTAPKPLVAKKQLSQKELEELAIKEATAEFHRIETAKRSAR